MFVRIGIWLTRALGIAFFIGLIGCAIVVILSWISIFKDGFSRDKGDHYPN
jgi:hypothetical protein